MNDLFVAEIKDVFRAGPSCTVIFTERIDGCERQAIKLHRYPGRPGATQKPVVNQFKVLHVL